MSFLELRVAYKQNMKDIESQLFPESENDFDNMTDSESIRKYLHNQRIRTYLNNLRQSYQTLGLRLGEEVDPAWLKGLTLLEKSVFVSRFANRKKYSEIAKKYSLPHTEVRHIFESSLRTVLNNII